MGQLRTDAMSILENRVQSGTEDVVDLAHFLPPTPRRLLYTFPSVSMGLSGSFPNSLWTASHFLTFQPVMSTVGQNSFLQTMQRLYRPVEGDPRFGDIVTLRRGGNGNAVLACVYIADDIVYTKTSRAMSRPWVLTQLRQLRAVARGESADDGEVRGLATHQAAEQPLS